MGKMSAIAGGVGPITIDTSSARLNPKFGTLIPNRIFVGGISSDTTESELCRVFSAYGNVKSAKIIVDRCGMSKGYGFVTFETEQEARRLQADGECVVLRDRKLNIAPAIRKSQAVIPTTDPAHFSLNAAAAGNINGAANVNGAVGGNAATAGAVPFDQFSVADFYPMANGGAPANTGVQQTNAYQYYSLPMNVPTTVWPHIYRNF